MGWGPLRLMIDCDEEPKEILGEFAIFDDGIVSVEVCNTYTPQLPDVYAYGYELMGGCDVVAYCSECGAAMCPGCGDRPFIIAVEEGKSAYCQAKDCRKARDKRLREYWPTVRMARS